MVSPEYKQFKDPVHGYIKISKDIVNTFIDTALFQRLRKIEQTSMRCLYPAARHDRFIHSLGVYHLGIQTIKSLFANISDDIYDKIFSDKDAREEEIQKIINSFSIACLMHDCAHSPFSHTFEKHYIDNSTHKKTIYIRNINDLISSDEQIPDSVDVAEHEIISSYVLLKSHKDDIISFGADPELTVRCILGAEFTITNGNRLFDLYNAVISLLNSKNSIDVDKLDYIIRDTYESGVENLSIDVARFIASVTLVTVRNSERLLLGYKKSSLSVLMSIMYARDYLFRWIYSHHKVVYIARMQNILLKKADEKFQNTSNDFISKIFDSENFFTPTEIKEESSDPKRFMLHLVDDGDINYIFKEMCSDSIEFKAVYHRKQHESLWKSFAEYKVFFEDSVKKSDELKEIVTKIIAQYCTTRSYTTDDFIIETIKLKVNLGWIDPEVIYVSFSGISRNLLEIYGATPSGVMSSKESFFYLYIPYVMTDVEKSELVNLIKANI